ncbi:MAG TPA: carbon-nitrogen family hydrolase [Tepidisphaeraceae bacterium]|jgi:predicted amidohydrolase
MRIHCVQLDITWEDKAANHAKVRALLHSSRPNREDLVLLPEMFSTGFSMNVATVADDQTGADQTFISALAKELQVNLVAGLVTRDSAGKGLNQAMICDPSGQQIARYTKIHCFSPGKEALHYRGGSEIAFFDWQGLKVCPFICYDLRFPEIFRAAVRRGAQLFVIIANWPSLREEHWVTLLRARAIENQAYVAAVNRAGADSWLPYPGRSMIIDPKGNVLVDAGSNEKVISAPISQEAVTSWRQEFAVLRDMRDTPL